MSQRGPVSERTFWIDNIFAVPGKDVSAYLDCPERCRRVGMQRRTHSNGTVHVWLVCSKCGRPVQCLGGELVRQAIDAGCVVSGWDGRWEREQADRDRSAAAARVEDNLAREMRYREHLASDKWKTIRAAVLRRDRGLCQGCLEAPAVHVHHLTYVHLGEELLFELTSLCKNCHERVHPHMREG